MLRREYVLVDDAPAVEVHRTVDGMYHRVAIYSFCSRI